MSKSPEATYRFGNVSCSVFVQETSGDGPKRKFRTISVQKSYKDGDETKFGNSFTNGDMPSAIRAMQLAQAHVEAKEAEVTA